MIFLLEISEIQRKEEPWKIFQRYLINGYNTSENVYNFSKMIIKHIISIEDWGISTMKERQINLNKISMNFTYRDYIQAFDKVLYYINDRHKHTWFIKYVQRYLQDQFLIEWVKVSPDLNELYHTDHICYI
ncbi:hypothetical protein H5410_015025 [Solanum commersonii]|uniref:Uncharacterized protein n=1 Tax=Solanum commersonii TaxID=4109 RepID=A0A9J5ZSL4_SOLCO|nr:hypothetical protein H5410_015025 [Solanum commersonii]